MSTNRTLIGFKFLASQEEFEAWQINNPQFTISQVTPHLSSLSLTESTQTADGSASHVGGTTWGCFVVYHFQKELTNEHTI